MTISSQKHVDDIQLWVWLIRWLQVHIWPCCATSARDADTNQNRTWLSSWTLNCLNNFVSDVHSVRSRCNISLFRTSDDITIFWMFSWTITKLWIRSTTKFDKYPAMRCHWRASRFPCALLRSRHCWRCRFPCAGFHLLLLLPRKGLWWNTHQSQSWFPLLGVGKRLGEDVCRLKRWTNIDKFEMFSFELFWQPWQVQSLGFVSVPKTMETFHSQEFEWSLGCPQGKWPQDYRVLPCTHFHPPAFQIQYIWNQLKLI